jgi:hypothetical protein
VAAWTTPIMLYKSVLIGNSATSSMNAMGGAVCAFYPPLVLRVVQCTFLRNKAAALTGTAEFSAGGALYATSGSISVIVTGCTFTLNSAQLTGRLWLPCWIQDCSLIFLCA